MSIGVSQKILHSEIKLVRAFVFTFLADVNGNENSSNLNTYINFTRTIHIKNLNYILKKIRFYAPLKKRI